MRIDKINIENFKCFEGEFSLGLNEGDKYTRWK